MKTKNLLHRLPSNARILLIRLRSMGDCLLLTAPVRALKEEFPSFRISVLVEERFAPCFSNNPDFSEVIVTGGKYATAGRLFLRRFNIIINLHGGSTSLIYALAAHGKRIGAGQYRGSFLYHGLVPQPDSSAHTVESTTAIFRSLGLTCQTAPPLRFEKHESEAAYIETRLKGRSYAVIHPGSVMATKRWEPGRFAAVAQTLIQRGLTIVVTAGPGEETYASEVARQVDESVILLSLSIPQLGELIRGAKLYIGNDSGPMHLAAAVGTPVIAAWGSSDSRRWRPWGVDHRVVQNPFECNPCPGYRCLVADSPLCIESVTVEQVNAGVEDLIGKPAATTTKGTRKKKSKQT